MTLQVSDLARSIDYYERVLGLRVINGSPGQAMLGTEDGRTPLVALRERRGATPVPRRGRLGLYHFAILLPDRAALGRFIRHLAETGQSAGMSNHLVSEAVYLSDPDGLGIEVYADRPRGTWQHEGRQLVMATEPLDVENVVRAGGGEPWSGMPAGTTLGHVHLFVGDLDAAARFYHEGLGFDKTVWSYPGALFLSAGGYHHHLGTNTWAVGAAAGRAREMRGSSNGRSCSRIRETPPGRWRVSAWPARRSMPADGGGVARDPWGTAVRLRSHDS